MVQPQQFLTVPVDQNTLGAVLLPKPAWACAHHGLPSARGGSWSISQTLGGPWPRPPRAFALLDTALRVLLHKTFLTHKTSLLLARWVRVLSWGGSRRGWHLGFMGPLRDAGVVGVCPKTSSSRGLVPKSS